jgi:cation:H+ antiporter
MTLSILLVAVGLALLGGGGELLLRGAVGLAARLRLTPAIIGLTVVAAGTSVPELAVSASASLAGQTDIAVGNVVGSNIFNIAFILGLCAALRPLVVGGNTIRLEYPVMALVTLLCLSIAEDGRVSRIDATLLLAIYVCFTAYMVALVRRQMNETELREFGDEVRELGGGADEPARRPGRLVALLIGGIALLGLGAQATVTGAVELARLIGLSERVIGLTIVAIGTSLPEVVTSLVSVARGRDDVAIGNVIGSNLFNILGILGLSALVSPLEVHPLIIARDQWWMFGVTLLLLPLMYTGFRVVRWEGGLLLAIYAAYLVQLLTGA